MSLPANMTAAAATRSTQWAGCLKVRFADGGILALTEHDSPLTVDLGDGDGAVEYLPDDGLTLSDWRVGLDLAADDVEVIAAVDSERVRHADIHGGRFDDASAVIFEVDFTDPQSGQWIHVIGPVGPIETEGEQYKAEILSILSHLDRNIGFTVGGDCPKSFGSSASTERHPLTPCGVDLDPAAWEASAAYAAILPGDRLVGDRVKPTTHNGFWYACTTAGTSDTGEPSWPTTVGATVADNDVVWTAERALAFPGTVTTVTDHFRIEASGISVAADFFSRARIEWLTGANAGLGHDTPVMLDDGSGALTLYRAPINPVEVGDTFTIFAGCGKSQAACIGFSNWINKLGHHTVPPVVV